MNIFEILATDSSESNSLMHTLGQAQRNWTFFRQNTCEFLAKPSKYLEAEGENYWK